MDDGIKTTNTDLCGKRVLYFDILRAIACLSVVLYHVSGNYIVGFVSNVNDLFSFNYWSSNLLYAISRLGVPLFVMISGALFLDESREFTLKKMKTHIIKILCFYIYWSLVYAIVFKVLLPVFHHESISVEDFFSVLRNDAYHLWFCPMIIGLYIITPLLRLWVKKANKKNVEYFLIIAICYSVVISSVLKIVKMFAELPAILDFIEQIGLDYVCGYVLYYVLGWYLHNFKFNKVIALIIGIVGLIITVLSGFVLSIVLQRHILIQDNFNLNNLIMAISVVVLIKLFCEKNKANDNLVTKGFLSVSKYSFGIYGVHGIMLYIATAVVSKINNNNAILVCLSIFIITSISSYIVSFVFSKIPLLKKVV